jgi:hypothetical protein
MAFFRELEPCKAARKSAIARCHQDDSSLEWDGDQLVALLDSSHCPSLLVENHSVFII